MEKFNLKDFMAKETSKDMTKFIMGGTSTLIAAKLLTTGCIAFSICLVVSLLILVGMGFAVVNRK